jgi:hypothetical protein
MPMTIPCCLSAAVLRPAEWHSRRRRLRRQVIAPDRLRRIIEDVVSEAFRVSRSELRHATRGCARIAFARQAAMYLAHVACGLRFAEIGRIFQRDRTTVAHACAVVEDRRDDRRLDRVLDMLACALVLLGGREHAAARLGLAAPVSCG